MGKLTSKLHNLLLDRFKHYSPEQCDALFAAEGDQRSDYDGHPCVRMANDVLWFPDRASRPDRPKTGEPMKSKAPVGVRRLLVHGGGAAELLLVEGEGHLVACASVGLSGVVCAGGTNGLRQRSEAAKKDRERVFKGKRVRILFDADEGGKKGRREAAKALLEAGADKVAYVDVPEDVDGDVEDWLGTFPIREAALGGLLRLLGAVDWEADDAAGDKEPVVRPVLFDRVDGWALATTYDSAADRTRLALLPPSGLAAYGDLEEAQRGWQVADEWEHGGVLHVPARDEATMTMLRNRSLILPPPPPATHGSSEGLWEDVRTFIQRYLKLPPGAYDVLTAFVFLSYRLHDAGFTHTPYLRFWGASNTGKSWALNVMSQLCWRSYTTQVTATNLHRIIDYLGEITLVMDEFHLSRGRRTDAAQQLVDILNLGFERRQTMARMEKDRSGGMRPNLFSLFGLRIFSSYKEREEEAFARRSVAIDMDEAQLYLPEEQKAPDYPPEFYAESEALRGRLLAWRASKDHLGSPSPASDRAKELFRRAGSGVGQVFWPLVEMVPAGMDAELESIYGFATGRGKDVQQSKEHGEEAAVLQAVRDALADGQAKRYGGAYFVPVAAIYSNLSERHRDYLELVELNRFLHNLGLERVRRRPPGQGNPCNGVDVQLDGAMVVRAMKSHGIPWPPEVPGGDGGPGL